MPGTNHSSEIARLTEEITRLKARLGRTNEAEITKIWEDVAALKAEREKFDLEKILSDVKMLQRQISSQSPSSNISNLPDDVKRMVQSLHNQYKQEILIEQENKLAGEIRQVYCQVSALERNQAIILAQGNGLLAAAALKMPICSRLQGFGETLLLQQCREQRTNIIAIETKCGFQPFFSYNHENCTLGIDGWSIHLFSDCFWQTHLVNINGKPHAWTHDNGHSTEQKPNLHSTNLELISEFEELPLNDYDFSLKAHPAHETTDLEQLNVLNDLMGRIQETNSNSFSTVIMTERQQNHIEHTFTWIDTLKIMVLSVIGFVLFLVCLRIFIALNPFPKLVKQTREKRKKQK